MTKDELRKLRKKIVNELAVLEEESMAEYFLAIYESLYTDSDISEAPIFEFGINKRFGVGLREVAIAFPELAPFITNGDKEVQKRFQEDREVDE